MINEILKNQLGEYDLSNIVLIKDALREISQKIILCGLARGGFFDHVIFYGGTSARIFYGLERFSEDLDFTLIKEENFDLNPYMNFAVNEMKSIGINAYYDIKQKSAISSTITSYIKFNLQETLNTIFENNDIIVNKEENISIKIDLETIPHKYGKIEMKTLLFPTYFKSKVYDIETLFSCKIVAILNRKWKDRVKGRDYFDFLYYVSKNIQPNYEYLKSALELNSDITKSSLKEMLKERFETVDFKNAFMDVKPFIPQNSRFKDCFKKEIFLDILENIF